MFVRVSPSYVFHNPFCTLVIVSVKHIFLCKQRIELFPAMDERCQVDLGDAL